MLTVDVKINGRIIGTVQAINRGGEPGGRDLYELRVTHDQTQVPVALELAHGRIRHRRADGAWRLAQAMLNQVVVFDQETDPFANCRDRCKQVGQGRCTCA